jgi:hypothetical protein
VSESAYRMTLRASLSSRSVANFGCRSGSRPSILVGNHDFGKLAGEYREVCRHCKAWHELEVSKT